MIESEANHKELLRRTAVLSGALTKRHEALNILYEHVDMDSEWVVEVQDAVDEILEYLLGEVTRDQPGPSRAIVCCVDHVLRGLECPSWTSSCDT